MATKTVLVTSSEIRSAVNALEDDLATGRISEAEAAKRINNSKRAVTPRELWKASGGEPEPGNAVIGTTSARPSSGWSSCSSWPRSESGS